MFEVFSFHPFTMRDIFNLKEISIDLTSDLKYVGGVIKAFQKDNTFLPYKISVMKLRFVTA
ncbi:MAG: hypothetical protein QW279_00035 [Candidatus Jordarchaeaceae archaeon]